MESYKKLPTPSTNQIVLINSMKSTQKKNWELSIALTQEVMYQSMNLQQNFKSSLPYKMKAESLR